MNEERTGKCLRGTYPWSFVTRIFHAFHIVQTVSLYLEIDSEGRLRTLNSIFQLWNFHLYVVAFQQHLHMEYISLSWYDIPELLVHVRNSLIEGYCYQGSYWTMGSSWLSWSHHFESFTVTTMTWMTLWNICVKNDHGYIPFVVSTRSFPHSWLIT